MVSRLTTIFFHPVFFGSIGLYVLIRFWRTSTYAIPDWINGYITDLICMPVVLMICLAFVRLIKSNSEIIINKWLIGFLCIEYAILFEWILPQRSSIYTGDWLDVVMYFLGGFIFYFIQPILKKKNLEKQISN